jgi:hypothetical protein
MMSIDEECVLSVQLVPSFLPFFAFFFFLSYHPRFSLSLFLSITFVSFQSLIVPSRSFSLFQGTLCIHLDHINVIIITHCIYICEQQVREREKRKKA